MAVEAFSADFKRILQTRWRYYKKTCNSENIMPISRVKRNYRTYMEKN